MARFVNLTEGDAPSADPRSSTPEQDLDRIADEVARIDAEVKALTSDRDLLRAEFLGLATDMVVKNQSPLPRQVVVVGTVDPFAVKDEVARSHPDHVILDMTPDAGSMRVTLELDPSKVKYTWTNEKSGNTISRQIATVGVGFDAEKFHNEAPDQADGLVEVRVVTTYTLDDDAAQERAQEDPDIIPILQRYVIPGKIQIKVAAKAGKK